MAKEQLHNWGRYILLAATIIFACGGYALKVSDNSKGVEDNAKEIKDVKEESDDERRRENLPDKKGRHATSVAKRLEDHATPSPSSSSEPDFSRRMAPHTSHSSSSGETFELQAGQKSEAVDGGSSVSSPGKLTREPQ